MSRRKQTKPQHLQSDSEGEEKSDSNNGRMTGGTQPHLETSPSRSEQLSTPAALTDAPAPASEQDKGTVDHTPKGSGPVSDQGKGSGDKESGAENSRQKAKTASSSWQDSSPFKANLSQITPPPKKRGRPPKLSNTPRQLTDYSKSHSAIATALVLAAASPRRQSSRLHPPKSAANGAGEGSGKKMSHRTCEYCGVVKPTPAALQRHLRKHTGERPFVCQVCQKAYKAKRSLLCHQISHHPELGDTTSPPFIPIPITNGCNMDGISSMTVSPSTSHLLRETLATRRTTGRGYRKEEMAQDIITANGDEGQVDSVEVPESADSSGVSSASKNISRSPSSAETTQDFSINVSTMGNSSINTSTDTTDVDGEDGVVDISRRSCPHCHKDFVKPSDLKRHLMVHTGEKPHVCQFCKKGFKQPQSLNYHLKATHKLDIPLSQGLEERYLRLKTRAAMRDLAAMDGWSPRLQQDRGGSMSQYGTDFSASSVADPRADSLDTERDDHQQLLSAISQSFASYSPDFKHGLPGQSSLASDGSWSEDRGLGPNIVEVELPEFPVPDGQVKEEVDQGSRKVPMVVKKEKVLFTHLEGVCATTGQAMQVFRCCLCDKICASLFHAVSHLSLHFERNMMGLECRPCNLAFTSQTEMDEHYQRWHSVTLNDLDLQNNNHNFKSAKNEERPKQSDSPRDSAGKQLRAIDDLNNNNDNHINKEHAVAESNGASPNPEAASSSSFSEQKDNQPSSSYSAQSYEEDSILGISDESSQFIGSKGAHRCPKCSKCYMTKFLLDRHLAFHTRQNLIEAAMKSGAKINGAHKDLLLQPPPVLPQDSEKYFQLKGLNGAYSSQQYRVGEGIIDQISSGGIPSLGDPEDKEKLHVPGTDSSGDSGLENQSVLDARALLEQEGIQEDVTVVIPSDPDVDEGTAPVMETEEIDEIRSNDVCESEIRSAPKRHLIEHKTETVPSKSRRKSSLPTRHRSAFRDAERPSAHFSPPAPQEPPEQPAQDPAAISTNDQEEVPPSTTDSHSSSPKGTSETPPEGLADSEEEEVNKEFQRELLRMQQPGFLQNLHSAFGKVPSSLLGSVYPTNGFLPPSSLAAAAAAGYLQQLPPLSGRSPFSLHASASVNPSALPKGAPSSPLSQHSGYEGEQAEDLSLSSGSLSSPNTSQPSTLPTQPEQLLGYPRVVWDNRAWARGGDRSPSPSALPPSSAASGKRLNPVWHTLSTEDLSNATSTDGRKVTSLSRTHSRLYVVNQPVDRERICTPTVLPDGRTVFRCIFCQKDFLSYSDINRHMDFHEDIRPYKCNFCEYYARTNSQLKVHMMRHQGIREYCCRLCKYKGVTQSDLNRHMKSQIHLLKSRNECSGCGEGFVTSKNLEKHHSLGCKGTRKGRNQEEDS